MFCRSRVNCRDCVYMLRPPQTKSVMMRPLLSLSLTTNSEKSTQGQELILIVGEYADGRRRGLSLLTRGADI